MIFHVAYRLASDPKNASALRPVRMRRAFEAIGYNVHEISGTHAERRKQMQRLKSEIRAGLRIDFVYSEAATTPTGLGEPVTKATSLTRDIAFLRFCQRADIPVGLFYRDIYWRFPIYTETVKWPLSAILRAFYRWDLRRYRRGGFRIYLPSLEMAEWLPMIPRERIRALPPGGDAREIDSTVEHGGIRILYVGGLGSNYRLRETIAEISQTPEVSLTLCIPEAHWRARSAEYADVMAANVKLVHQSGSQLDALYRDADVCLLAVEPIKYWGFAAPVKLFEYVSHGKPILASTGTYSGRFVVANDLGWSVDYGSGALRDKLDELLAQPDELQDVAQRVRTASRQHTWEARALQVAKDLAGASWSASRASDGKRST
ncbi:glycosyltransferase family protein [Leucobacter alluvii]